LEDVVRRAWAGICLVVFVVAAGCGGGEMTLTEYAEELNAIVGRAGQRWEAYVATPQGEVLVAGREQLTEFTPQDLQAALEGVWEIEIETRDAAAAIDPPEQVADLHRLLFGINLIPTEEALAARAGTAADWSELSETPEMAAYRAVVAETKQVCTDFQSELDATTERGVFADVPWIPGELKEVIEAVLGCGFFAEHPEDIYRPLPTSTP
jgi:hypothetical protein